MGNPAVGRILMVEMNHRGGTVCICRAEVEEKTSGKKKSIPTPSGRVKPLKQIMADQGLH